jgi:hypothetical protein
MARRIAVVLIVVVLGAWFAVSHRRTEKGATAPAAPAAPKSDRPLASPPPPVGNAVGHTDATAAPVLPPALGATGAAASVSSPSVEDRITLADSLNAPGGSIQRDLHILQEILAAWRSNFPRDGNPVGENAEITAALMGKNRFELALIPKDHSAVNPNGELCDRWGTPFRFHQISGDRMELRSAGPDRKFGTPDDTLLEP